MSAHPRWPRYDRTKLGNVWNAIEDLQDAVDHLYTADEIAAAVSEKIKAERVVTFTIFQKLGGAVVAACAIATAVHSWVG